MRQTRYGLIAALAMLLTLALAGIGLAGESAPADARDAASQGCGLYPYLHSICLMTPTPTITPTPSLVPLSPAEGLIVGLNDPPCVPACWIGIQPGVTTIDQAIAYAAERGFTLELTKIDTQCWILTGTVYDLNPMLFVGCTGEDTDRPPDWWTVRLITFYEPVNIRPILTLLGAPSFVYRVADNGDYQAIYLESGLDLTFNSEWAPGQFTWIRLWGAVSEERLLGYYSFDTGLSELVTECETPGVGACLIPTATPTPPPG